MSRDKIFNSLLEAARQVTRFGGPTPENLKALDDCVDACDQDDRDRGYDPADEDDEAD